MKRKSDQSISERRIQNNRFRRRCEKRRNILMTLLTICLVFTLALTVNGFLSSAHSQDKPVYYKYYSSISVSKGDTLWSIAGKHMDSHYRDAASYVKEVMAINSMQDDTIRTGQYLVIPYYSAEFLE